MPELFENIGNSQQDYVDACIREYEIEKTTAALHAGACTSLGAVAGVGVGFITYDNSKDSFEEYQQTKIENIENKIAVLESWKDSKIAFVDKEETLTFTTVKDLQETYEKDLQQAIQTDENVSIIAPVIFGVFSTLILSKIFLSLSKDKAHLFTNAATSIVDRKERRDAAKIQKSINKHTPNAS